MTSNKEKRFAFVEMMHWTGNNLKEIIDWIGLNESAKKWTQEEYEAIVKKEGLKLFTPLGSFIVELGTFIIKMPNGMIYPYGQGCDDCEDVSTGECYYPNICKKGQTATELEVYFHKQLWNNVSFDIEKLYKSGRKGNREYEREVYQMFAKSASSAVVKKVNQS